MSFLAKLSQSIVESGVPLQETVIVLPNERARRMLINHLATHLKLPAFMPAIYSIESFVSQLSPLQTVDKLELVAELYETSRQMTPPVADTFDQMLTWAPAYLSDIDEIDMQMQDGEYVFRTLAFDKEFVIAMAHADEQSALQEKMHFYSRLAELYGAFQQYLLQQRKAYSGLKYRDCADHIADYVTKMPYKHYVFAGFHVFTPSEIAIVKHIKTHFNAQFFFDIDDFYCDFNQDERFTTAFFLQKLCTELDIPIESLQYRQHDYTEREKNIQVVGVSKVMNQIYYCIDQLEKIKAEQGDLNDTAVVLADEHLLVPFLSAYGADDVNVTMGYPFTETPAYPMMLSLLEMYQNALRLARDGQLRFHHRDVVSVVRNPLVNKYALDDPAEMEDLADALEDNQRALYLSEDLPHDLFPAFDSNPGNILDGVIHYVEGLASHADSDSQDYAMLGMLSDILKKTESVLEQLKSSGVALSMPTIKYALGQQFNNVTLPVKGDPLRGLQVMGLLETRTLDFKHVIMLSVNEGTLPAGISSNSLLPFEIRYDNNSLPNYLYKDQVYAYHFFRLLQRAEDIVLIYDNDTSTSLSEKSRFITQLEFIQKERQLDNIHISHPTVGISFKAGVPELLTMPKTEEVMQRLKTMKYSATAITTYVNCPLQFYFRYACGILPRNTFKDRIESNTIGSWVHALLEEVFNRVKDNPADSQGIISDYLKGLDERVAQMMLADPDLKIRQSDLERGRIYLASRIVNNFVANYLQKAKKVLEEGTVRILYNELKLLGQLTVGDTDVALTGTIDRLQLHEDQILGGFLEVIDYKTGGVKDDGLHVDPEMIGGTLSDVKYKQFVQLLFYCLLLQKARLPEFSQKKPAIRCGIVSLKESNKNRDYPAYWHPVQLKKGQLMASNIYQTITDEVIGQFEESLKMIIKDILTEELSFEQTRDSSHCLYCDYRQICRK